MEPSRKDFEEIAKGRWEWKSNADPWSKSEEPQWKSYSLEHNYLIEKAYFDQQKEVDLGDYIVSIKHMIQKQKGNLHKQRPIRRINWGDDRAEKSDRSERYFETELPKTINKIFGSLKDFLCFFSRRNPEILEFTQKYEEIERSNDLEALNSRIIPRLVECLEEALKKPILEKLQDPSLSMLQKNLLLKKKKANEGLISMFEKDFFSFEEFYGHILRAYTMGTCLYANLNRYLRNEHWTEIDKLLPYAFCLCKAFFNFELKKFGNCFKELRSTLLLYRGTAFDEYSLSSYNVKKTQYFSWNSVTSTSIRREVAEEFMYKSADLRNDRYPVLFVIELSPTNNLMESEYLKWIDVHRYSIMPKEDEVILAPGSAFELLKCSTDKEKRTIIQIRLRNEVKSLAHAGLIMPGAFQREMMTDKGVKILCLEGEELHDALNCLTKNKLIEEVEFCLCVFDNQSLRIMMEVLSTLERAKALRFISCVSKDKEKEFNGVPIGVRMWNPGISKVEIFEMNDFYKLFTLTNKDEEYWVSLNEFSVSFRKNRSSRIDNQWLQGLKHLTELKSLTLDFGKSEQMTDKGIENLASKGLQYLSQLRALTLDFSGCHEIADKGLHSLATKGLNHLTQLTSLNLNFSSCDKITHKGLKNITSDGFQHLTQLSSFSLDFSYCDEITDESLYYLCSEGLKNLTQLTSLTLDLSYCKQITDQGVHNLVSGDLQHLTQLTFLSLDFSGCRQVTDKVLRSFREEGFKHLMKSASLEKDNKKLIFTSNPNNAKPWSQETLPPSKKRKLDFKRDLENQKGQFPTLNTEDPGRLDFSQPPERLLKRDLFEMAAWLSSRDFFSTYLFNSSPRFLSLVLHFRDNTQITDQEIWHLVSGGLKHLTQLKSLTLDFSYCRQITDEGVNSIALEGLQSLTKLESLSLDFSYCDQITNSGVNKLTSEGIKFLPQLSVLAFSSQWCQKITDEGIQNLAYGGLKHLFQLKSLTLNFSGCRNITDQGISNMISQGIKHRTQLMSLTLNFKWCSEITDEGIQNLAYGGLKHLTQLKSLALDFSYCTQITDDGVNSITYQGLKHLIQLTSLTLDFKKCNQITEFTLSNIIRVLHYFGFSALDVSDFDEALNYGSPIQ